MKGLIAVWVVIVTTMVTQGLEAQIKTNGTAPSVGINVGNIAPNLKFKDPDGKEVSLYSLRGKVVLIDFWASWCRPCRIDNPNVVAAYKKYNNAKLKDAKGFEIFGVSLDKNRAAWKKAIQQDGLIWKYHISDLNGWKAEPARIYHVRSIPANVLIDAKGIIIAKNLHGPQLHYQMDKLVQKFKKDK